MPSIGANLIIDSSETTGVPGTGAPVDALLDEDGTTFLVDEDDTTFLVDES